MKPDDLRRRAAALRGRIPPRHQATPPQETGKRIGTVERSADEQIRVTWCEYQGKPYVNLRLWRRDSTNDTWWPDAKRGISIRIRELPDMCDALAAAVDLAAEQLRPSPDREQGPRRGYDPGALPPASQGQGGNGEFDEFATGR
jgi:hypothetical protein